MHHALTLFAALFVAPAVAADEITLAQGDEHAGALATGDTHVYVLQAGAEHFVHGQVDQLSVDVALRVLGPDGDVLAEIDGPARGPEVFLFETESAGPHRIEVSPFEDETGDYAITLRTLEPVATDPVHLADQLLAPYDRDDTPGAVVSVWKDGETLFRKAYGMANLTYGIPYAVDTRCNIGSTSKQFTAMAVLLLLEEGKLSLDDDVRAHIPELPDLGHTVTVRHLLTHTSGYREFLNFLGMTGRRLDRGDSIDRRELIDIVRRQPALQNEPGAEWNYNNTAFGLAAVIVERLSGQDFPDFVRERIFEPLGMSGSTVRATPAHIVPDRAEGYVPDGDDGWLELGDLGGAVGAGGIYTTVADLQRWIGNYTDPRVGSAELVEQMMTPYVLTGGEATGYGMGLFVDEQRGLRRVHHGGGDVAHRSQLVYFPEIDAGLTTQSNHAGFDGGIAFRLAGAFFGEHMQPEPPDGEASAEVAEVDGEPSDFDIETFADFAGRYALDVRPSFVLTLSREGEAVYVQGSGQPRVPLEPTSATTFELVGVEASITVHREADGSVGAITLHQGGDNRATRLADDPLSEAELGDYAGRYFSEEAETFYTISLEDGALVLRQRRRDDAALDHVRGETFAAGGDELTFERDRNGRVVAFYMANGRTRDVRFARVSASLPR